MEKILSKFAALVERPYERLRDWKEANSKKLIGCTPMHFPEELVHAAGMCPIILQESDEPVTVGHAYIYPFFCGFTRSNIDFGVKGRLNFLDGLIFFDTCLQIRGACSTLQGKLPVPYYEFVQFPLAIRRPAALAGVMEEMKRFRAGLEAFAGQKITDESLRQSILIYNKNRALLRRLYDLRRQKPGLLRAKQFSAIVTSSMLVPKEAHSELLEELLPRLERSGPSPADNRVRLFLSGHLCHAPKVDIMDLIEEAGGVIVDDDLYTGHRYFATDVEVNGNPLEALAKRYLENSPPCPTRSDPQGDLGQYLVEMVARNHAQGVVILLVKFCEPHIFHYPHLRQTLSAAGIPHLLLETEHEVVSLGGVKTRLQAFMEMVRKGER